MSKKVVLNTEKLSEMEKKTLEASFSYECVLPYNLTGAKQYTFYKEEIVCELKKDLLNIENRSLKIQKNNMIRIVASTVACAVGCAVSGIALLNVMNPFVLGTIVGITWMIGYKIDRKITDRKMEDLNAAYEVRSGLIGKIEDEYEKQNKKKNVNTNEIVSTKFTTTEKEKNIDIDVATIETVQEEKPKQMIKTKRNEL